MKIKIDYLNDAFHLRAKNEDGCSLEMDGSEDIGGKNLGMRPMQLLLSALGGCSAIDIILILKKQRQVIDAFQIEVEGIKEKVNEHSIFKQIIIHFIFTGNLNEQKVEKAVELSLQKYCSVAKALEPTSQIKSKITIHERK